MYNPTSIVDLRNNTSFHQNRSTPSSRINRVSSSGGWHDLHSPPEMLIPPGVFPDSVMHSGRHRRSSINIGVPKPTNSVCDGCFELQARVSDLESKLFHASERIVSFEQEVLCILRNISTDLRDMKRNGTPPIDQSMLTHRVAPPPLDFSGFNKQRRSIWENTPPSQNRQIPEGTREAIAGACVALEKLIAEAKVSTGTVYRS